MKLLTPLALSLAGIFAAGCAYNDFDAASKIDAAPKMDVVAKTDAVPMVAPKTAAVTAIVTPDNSLKAKVAIYNAVGRFVVVRVSAGQMPKPDQPLFLYRNGLKVAELKVSGPQNENNTVADLVIGEAQVGDDVRDR